MSADRPLPISCPVVATIHTNQTDGSVDDVGMGLFSKRSAEPLTYPEVARVVHVRADGADVIAHLAAYSELWSPKRAQHNQVEVGEIAGWTAIRLPQAVHPWQLHNLAFWMLGCPGTVDDGVIAESEASPDHAAYRLVRDPAIDDALCGWDDRGTGWTVHVPGNDVVRGDDVPVPRSLAIPSGHQNWRPVAVLLEDPGRGMNESNEQTVATRKKLMDRGINFVY